MKQTKIPRPEDLSTEMAALIERQNSVSAQKAPKKARLEELNAFLYGLNNNVPVQDGLSKNVRNLVGGTAQPDHTDFQAERLRLLQELHDLTQAEEILAEMIYRERSRASTAVCDAVRPDHDTLAKTLASRFLDLYRAYDDYTTFLDRVSDVGVSIEPLKPIRPTILGHVKDPSGSFHYVFEEMVESGAIKKDQVPEAVR